MRDDILPATGLSDAHALLDEVAIRLEARRAGLTSGEMPLPAPLPAPAPGGAEDAMLRLFGLGVAERALLATAVAVALEPALEDQVAELQGRPWRPLPTEALVRALFPLRPEPIWRPTAAIARWRLLAPVQEASGAAPAFRADPRILDWLLGKAALDDGLVGRCRIPTSPGIAVDWPLDRTLAAVKALAAGPSAVRVHIVGPEGSGRTEFAAALFAAMGLGTLEVEGASLPDPVEDHVLRVQRFALLTGRVPVWRSLPVTWPGHVPQAPLQAITLAEITPIPGDRARVLDVAVPPLPGAQRQRIWRATTGQPLPAVLARAPLAELRAMAALAPADGAVAQEVQDRAGLALAQLGRVVTPRAEWTDLIVDPPTKRALTSLAREAKGLITLSEDEAFRRHFLRDAAPTALFTGPPGVGKTLAAECLAAELGMPLLVIDLSRTISKYIGETASNLSRIFAAARHYGCVLFFDEADALFGKRTELRDSHDRHANADTGHLLQLVEAYEGCVILASNRRAHIDEAFLRRLRHVVTFQKPNKADRARLWTGFAGHLFAPETVAAAQEGLKLVAERLDLTPAQIKAAVLTLRYAAEDRAEPLAAGAILQACARELAKEGRSLPPDLTRQQPEPAHVD